MTEKIIQLIKEFFIKNKYLIGIILLGTVLRFLAVISIEPIADEMVHGSHAIGIIGSNAINHQNQSPIWFYLTDIAYKLLGVTFFSARFLSFFFGILTIPLLYLIVLKLFNSKKTALISSFLLSISFFTLRFTLSEMDISMIFFLLISFYYFILGIEKSKLSYFAVIFFFIALLTKPIALAFLPSYLIIFFLKDENPDNNSSS